MCHVCRGHKKIRRLIYTQFQRDSRLRKTCYSWKQLRNWSSSQGTRSPLFLIPGFEISRCFVDAMHCVDLGLLQSIIPSCLVELCEEGVWEGGTRQERFVAAHVDYKGFCNSISERAAPRFNDSKWCPDGDYPKLTQNLAKAFQTRTMQYWLYQVC